MDVSSESRRIERVVLACVQCRLRHVKCDATQPICNRCEREGKECTFQKSRRGGLDKAALARRRQRLQQASGCAQPSPDADIPVDLHPLSSTSLAGDELPLVATSSSDASNALHMLSPQLAHPGSDSLAFHINEDWLLELFFENFWPAFPCVLPKHYLQARQLRNDHGISTLLPVVQWIGSIYASWSPSEPYFEAAVAVIGAQPLAQTPFNVQALMLYAIALYHFEVQEEARKKLNLAVAMAIELHMNERWFARAYGEADPVLEESWRRTFYLLKVSDQHFSIIRNMPIYTLLSVPSEVDLPCDDEQFISGQIPPVVSWREFENREFADLEIVYSSIAYLSDIISAVAYIVQNFLKTGSLAESLIDGVDAKLAVWMSLLPACKRNPLKSDGKVDEIMYMAHHIFAVIMSTVHRPSSSLAHSPTEMSTKTFLSPAPFVISARSGRGVHTARTLKAAEIHTRLLAIPCAVEKHSPFTMCIIAQLAGVQISACRNLLDDFPHEIGRDRIKLAIGFLNSMGAVWPLARSIAKEIQQIARTDLAIIPETPIEDLENTAATESPRDDLVWPDDPLAAIGIYSGIVLPIE